MNIKSKSSKMPYSTASSETKKAFMMMMMMKMQLYLAPVRREFKEVKFY